MKNVNLFIVARHKKLTGNTNNSSVKGNIGH